MYLQFKAVLRPGKCLRWVISRHLQGTKSCLLYPKSRHTQRNGACRLWAITGLMHRSNVIWTVACGPVVTSYAGLFVYREFDDFLRLAVMAVAMLADARSGKLESPSNKSPALLRSSGFCDIMHCDRRNADESFGGELGQDWSRIATVRKLKALLCPNHPRRRSRPSTIRHS